MIPIFATSTQANLLIYVGGGGFVLLGAFYFGRLLTFFFPKNPLFGKGKERIVADCEVNFGTKEGGTEIHILGFSGTYGFKPIAFPWYFFLLCL